MKKSDIILIVAVIAIAGIWFGFLHLSAKTDNEVVEVTIDGEEYGIYSLEKNQVVSIQNTNVLTIEDGTVDMTEADCPDKLCVHQKAISRDGESIICLPNKVVVTIKSDTDSELDAISN